MRIEPLTADKVTINGYRARDDSPAWLGLYLDLAELQDHEEDHRLRVPWIHPQDGPWDENVGCFYRVRPRRKRDRFVRVGGTWMVARDAAKRRVAVAVTALDIG